MRDYILLMALPFLIYAAFKRPFIGLALWVWTALVPPHIWSFGGLATSIRWNFLFAIITIVGVLFSRINKSPPQSGLFALGIIFFLHTTLTSIVAYGDGPYVWLRWDWFMRVFLLFFFMCLVVKKKLHFEAIAWAVALSFAFKAGIEGLKFLSSMGGHNVVGLTPGFNDNNLSALASLMCIPFILFLIEQYSSKAKLKYGLMVLAASNVLFVLATDSRGGFVGLAMLGLFYFVKTKHKFKVGFALFVIGIIALSLLSEDWFNRMETIQTAEEDSSFMGRVKSWKLAILMAMESPIFGGGFDSAFTNRTTVDGLIYNWSSLDWIYSTPLSVGDKVYVAHSIYFQVLADHGFVGFFLYLGLLYGCYRNLSNIMKKSSIAWHVQLAEKLRLSLFVFGVSGSLLSSAYNDLIFSTFALTACLISMHKRETTHSAVKTGNEQTISKPHLKEKSI